MTPIVCLCVFAFGETATRTSLHFPHMSWFRWCCNVFCFDLKSSLLQTRHQASILVKMRGVIAYLQKSDVCKNKWDFALTENGSVAQKCNKDLMEL